eukprot:scaffold18704_cov98-Cylindrotheca_fusiformis.AAC.2
MCQAVDEALPRNWQSRRREIVAVYLKLAKYERQENFSLLELCLWNIKIDEVTAKEEVTDREFCRINSGASIVIPQVQGFLDNLDVEDRCLVGPIKTANHHRRETMIVQQRFDDARSIEAARNHSRNNVVSRVPHAVAPLNHVLYFDNEGCIRI